jgi:hypothetical protein
MRPLRENGPATHRGGLLLSAAVQKHFQLGHRLAEYAQRQKFERIGRSLAGAMIPMRLREQAMLVQ